MNRNDSIKPAIPMQKLDEQALGAAVGGQSLLLNESMLAEQQKTDLLQGAVLDLESKGVGITHDHLPQGVGITHDHLPQGVGITHDHLPQGVGITHDHTPTGQGATSGFALPGGLDADAGSPTIGTMLGEKGGMVASGSGTPDDPFKGEDGGAEWNKKGGVYETDTAIFYKSPGMEPGKPGYVVWTEDAAPDTGKKTAVFFSDDEMNEIGQKAFKDLDKSSGDKSGGDSEKAPAKPFGPDDDDALKFKPKEEDLKPEPQSGGSKETTTDGEGTSIPGDVLKDVLDQKFGGSNPLVRTIDEGQTFTVQQVSPEEMDSLLNPIAPMDPDAKGTSGDVGTVAGFSVEKLHAPLVNPTGS